LITAVDTSVLVDVFGADPRHGVGSAAALRRCLNEGALVVCCIVWAETRAAFAADEPFASAMHALGIGFSALNERATALAGANWKAYRAAGGKRDRVMADFLIGAHAFQQCDRLLTRDRGYYRRYFDGLSLVDLSK
jgi:predicted nucleic acid-binding protein